MRERRTLLRWPALGVALSASLASLTASANPGGLAGYTGKPNAIAPQGESCNQCHNGGTAPGVTISGPTSLAAGQVAEYSLVVTTGQSRAAGAIAATDSVVLTPVSGLRDSFGEMVQDAPLVVSGGQATFRFKVTAPMSGTALRLWAVGLAANGSGTGGDRASHATKDVTVTGGTSPPPADAGSSGGSSSGGSSSGGSSSGGSSSGGTSSGGTSTGGTDAGTKAGLGGSSGESENDADPESRRLRNEESAEAAACSASPLVSSSTVALPGLSILAIFATLRRRRR